MKIRVFKTETVRPAIGTAEYYDILDMLELPSLKHGTAEFIGEFSHFITKSELRALKVFSYRGYDRRAGLWRNGCATIEGQRMFIEYAGAI